MPFATTGGYKLAYSLRRAGTESLVFVHGLGASKNSFDRCLEMEAFRDYTVAAIDLPGCGDSSWPENFSYTIEDQADLVLKWIKDLRLTHLILIGHSMGGVICLYLAEAMGQEVKAFFNLEGNLGCTDCTFSGSVASFDQKDFESYGFEQFKNRLQDAVEEKGSPGLRNYYENISRVYPTALYLSSASLVKESREGDIKERFLSLSVMKWYVFGETSLNPANRSFLDKHNISYFVVPQSGHFMMDDQPDVFFRMLLDVLENGK